MKYIYKGTTYLFLEEIKDVIRKEIGGDCIRRAFGIVTKRNRGTSYGSYIYNSDLDYFKTVVEASIDVLKSYQEEGKIITFPSDGIGTGKAMLKEKAPACWEYLCKRLKEEFNYNNGQ